MAVGTKAQSTPGAGVGTRRLLVVANETVAGKALLDEIAKRAFDGRTEVLVVAPALVSSPVKRAFGDVDGARNEANERLRRSLEAITRLGVQATGRVGEADPTLAIEDALRLFDADELIISTHPRERSSWLEQRVVERARDQFDQPITHVVVDLEAESEAARATTVARIPHRHSEEVKEELGYLPPMPLRDRLTLVIGIAGTVALGTLALLCPENGSFSGGCIVRGVIAIAAFMFTLWHGVALLIMGSVRYRGFWSKAAADLVLFGMPPAIVISLLVD
jgi:hypothetical protein